MSLRLFAPVVLVLAACAQTRQPDLPAALTFEEQLALNVVGPEHEWMGPMVGTFHGKLSLWMEPGGEPSIMEGTSVNTLTLDGRFLQQDWTATFEGMPMTGMGLLGYDTLRKRYRGFWIDNMTTAMGPVSTGQLLDERSLEMHVEDWDPSAGVVTSRRDVTRIVDRNHHTFEMYMTMPGEEEVLAMRIEYSRLTDDGDLQDGELTDEQLQALQALGYLEG